MEDRSHSTPQAAKTSKGGSGLAYFWVVLFGLVLVLMAWQWLDARARIEALRGELAQRVRDTEADSRDARLSAKQAQEAMREALAKVAQLDLRLSEYQNHQAGLESLYQELSRNRDEWVLAEIEQILVIAAQQLQLVGNVPAAVSALQTVDARLARSGRPQFAVLRKALARDIERLKAAPGLDVSATAVKLDQMIASVDSLTLAQDMRPQPEEPEQAEAQGLWAKLTAELFGELKQLVKIEKVDGTDVALASPPQAYFLRENLKLRLLNARISLMSRDEPAYRSDIEAAAAWLTRYIDTRSGAGAAMAAGLKQLRGAGPNPVFPTLNDSLAAVRGFKAPREAGAR